MYENRNPFPRHMLPSAGGLGQEDRPAVGGGNALRALAWSELTARLNAARDLRLLLRHETGHVIGEGAASFADAAASYFSLLGDGARDINSLALGAHKACDAISGEPDRNGDGAAPPEAQASPDRVADGMRQETMQEKNND